MELLLQLTVLTLHNRDCYLSVLTLLAETVICLF